jgi:DNA invertase Pin-like site-specific DNA recombinase
MKKPDRQRPRVRCAIYTRKSSEEGLEQDFNSLDAQREACAAYILSQAGEGWEPLAERFDDGGYSGGTLERPALQQLLKRVEAGAVDIIVVYKIDRLTRSLGDFARIIEVLDEHHASFVSVTQAFNTTTSMGRLTLNVLLSFAQFEREVTGERIRDKIAASKRKGLWMGGTAPLGYEPDGRTLKVNEAEAETVRHIYARYLELRSVHQLREELASAGIVSKRWISQTGRHHGGTPMNRGAIFHLLHNPLYVGEIRHGKERYPGQHAPIVDRETFEAVEALLDAQAAARSGVRASEGSLLRGLLFDDQGNPMSPVATRPRKGISYRYYVSTALLTGKREGLGSVGRVPAAALEQLVSDRLAALGLLPLAVGTARPPIERIVVQSRSVTITLISAIARQLDPIRIEAVRATQDRLEVAGNAYRLVVAAAFRRHRRAKLVVHPDGAALQGSAPDPALLKALARAERWKRDLLSGKAATLEEIATTEQLHPTYARRILHLAFLAPDLKWSILRGNGPPSMTLEKLRRMIIPDLWTTQRRLTRA